MTDTHKDYHKVEIDSPKCNRRFHVAWDNNPDALVNKTKVECPYCGITIYEAENHNELILVRQENLIHSPDGSRPMIQNCQYKPDYE